MRLIRRLIRAAKVLVTKRGLVRWQKRRPEPDVHIDYIGAREEAEYESNRAKAQRKLDELRDELRRRKERQR